MVRRRSRFAAKGCIIQNAEIVIHGSKLDKSPTRVNHDRTVPSTDPRRYVWIKRTTRETLYEKVLCLARRHLPRPDWPTEPETAQQGRPQSLPALAQTQRGSLGTPRSGRSETHRRFCRFGIDRGRNVYARSGWPRRRVAKRGIERRRESCHERAPSGRPS